MAKAKPIEKPWGLLRERQESSHLHPAMREYIFNTRHASYYKDITWLGYLWGDSRTTKLTKQLAVGVDFEGQRTSPRLLLTTISTAGKVDVTIHVPLENLQALKDAIAAAELMMLAQPEARKK